ncbi:DUF5655 domain-containing protein [Phaeacidiphilus oryzae]|uniref:DUF5655 domain-containing protein n=1 Tax=Phaeacidiphilus oryzae TaxID=348818 RepID=UPI0005684635|nr:DUF5655 domain-containing protein [Phaeacidiphilus oryzae]
MPGLKLFSLLGEVDEIEPRLADLEVDVQRLVEANMESMLGVRFLASEFVIDCGEGGRIDSLGLDENGAPVVIEYKRGTDPGVITQGLFYLAWLTAHRGAFDQLVRDRLGAAAAARVLWSAPRLICVAGDFTRYDAHAVREQRRSIDLLRYRFYGPGLFALETVASTTGTVEPRRARRGPDVRRVHRGPAGAMAGLASALDGALLGVGEGVARVQRRQYAAYRRLRNFACVLRPQQTKLLIYLRLDPARVDLVPGFTRDMRGLGHHGTGDLEVQLRTERDLERAHDLFRLAYAAA